MEARQFHNLIVIGTIDTLSDDGLSAQIRIGDIVTDMRPLPATYGQNFTANRPTLDTAQVLLVCPSGNLENSIVVGFIWSNAIQPYTTERHIDGFKFKDGTQIEYDSEAQELRVKTVGKLSVEAAKTIEIKAGENIKVTSGGTLTLAAQAINIEGPVTQTGGDMTSDGISAQKHIHTETSKKTKAPQ